MQRQESGRYEVTSIGREHIRAFIPAPLPPNPSLVLDGSLQQALESAVLALGRLDGVATLLPDEALFCTLTCVRKQCFPLRSRAPSRCYLTSCFLNWMKPQEFRLTTYVKFRTMWLRLNTDCAVCEKIFLYRIAWSARYTVCCCRVAGAAPKHPVNFAARRTG